MSVISFSEWQKKLAKRSESQKSKLKHHTKLEQLGQTPTDAENDFYFMFKDSIEEICAIYTTLDKAARNPFTTKSNFARESSFWVALCATEGFISTLDAPDVWGNLWRITEEGNLLRMELHDELKNFL